MYNKLCVHWMTVLVIYFILDFGEKVNKDLLSQDCCNLQNPFSDIEKI